MPTKYRRNKLGTACAPVLLAATLLVGCGGGDDDDSSQTRGIPGSASVSASGFTDFLRGLSSSETDEPLSLEGFTAPVDDTGEPAKFS